MKHWVHYIVFGNIVSLLTFILLLSDRQESKAQLLSCIRHDCAVSAKSDSSDVTKLLQTVPQRTGSVAKVAKLIEDLRIWWFLHAW